MILAAWFFIEVDSKGAFSKVNTSDETSRDIVLGSYSVDELENFRVLASWRARNFIADFCSKFSEFAACVLLYPGYEVDQ